MSAARAASEVSYLSLVVAAAAGCAGLSATVLVVLK